MIETLIAITALVAAHSGVDLDRAELSCLASNVYHEARGEPVDGQIAVAQVTLTRAADAGSVCAAVYAPAQFSWTRNRPDVVNEAAWRDSVETAAFVMAGLITVDYSAEATHYYAPDTVEPYWADAFEEVAMIGGHRFLR